jgi:hypothetical protein
MAYNRNHARALCTESEFKLFSASLADEISDHTPAQLRNKIERTRKLRDKYQDLFKRQRLADRARTGTKKGDRPDSNARTGDKVKLFSEVLARFESRVEKLDVAAKRKAARVTISSLVNSKKANNKKKVSAKTSPAPVSGTSGPANDISDPGFVSESAQLSAASKLARDNRAGAKRGMATAADKRSQARRDSRR